jgi:D-alanyl-lipoteichoic acid acyltransferase DltB (MBOAT superfamily)
MAYTSLTYLLVFLGSTTLAYYLCPLKYRKFVLLAASAIYYIICTGKRVIALFGTIVVIYLGALFLQKLADNFALVKPSLTKEQRKEYKKTMQWQKKLILLVCLLFSFGLLLLFKYEVFFAGLINSLLSSLKVGASIPLHQFLLPLGISYYTLQAAGYLIDVYRGKYPASRNFGKVALFLCFFPQMMEGPIGRFDALADQLYTGKKYSYETVCRAIQLIFWGLFKKLVLADRAGIFVTNALQDYQTRSGALLCAGMVMYTLQIYADFSGCIDIARGSAELFGVELAPNFQRPFFSQSVAEFWRRWHVTLGTWLRDYVFYSVSLAPFFQKLSKWTREHCGNYLATLIPATVALLAVWLGNGFWHGAGLKYICYGMYYFLLTLLGMIFAPAIGKFFSVTHLRKESWHYRLFSILRTFLLVNIGMLLFRSDTVHMFFETMARIFSSFTASASGKENVLSMGLDINDFIVLAVGTGLLFAVGLLQERGARHSL